MKKNLSLLLLLLVVFSCKRDTPQNVNDKSLKTITLSQALGGNKLISSAVSANTITKVITWTEISDIYGFSHLAPFTISGVTFISTHGHIEYGNDGAPTTPTVYVGFDHTDYLYGSGFAIKYPFKKGKSYKVSFTISPPAVPQGHKATWPVILEAQLTNSVNQDPKLNNDRAPNLAFGNDKPKFDFNAGQTPYGTKSIEFTPNQCYEYLWFSLQSKKNDNIDGVPPFLPLRQSMTIEETSILAIEGPALNCANAEGDFKVTASGYTISDPFDWTVTGGLQIIGSSTGSSVRIKGDGNGGTISIGSGGCVAMAIKTIPTQKVTFKPYKICDYDTPFILSANPVDGVLSRRWVAKTDQGDVTLAENTEWEVNVPIHTTIVDLYVTTSCGEKLYRNRIALTNCGL